MVGKLRARDDRGNHRKPRGNRIAEEATRTTVTPGIAEFDRPRGFAQAGTCNSGDPSLQFSCDHVAGCGRVWITIRIARARLLRTEFGGKKPNEFTRVVRFTQTVLRQAP
jgi:hypothetical protein